MFKMEFIGFDIFFFNIKFNRQLLLLKHILHIFYGASRNVCRD